MNPFIGLTTFCLRKATFFLLIFASLALIGLADRLGGLQIGTKVPDFQLTSQDNKPTRLSDFRGKVVLVSFLFTQCPDPSKCPMLAGKLDKLQELIEQIEEAKDKVQLISITLDPKNDTPERLKAYAQGREHASSNWTFLTGKGSDILKVASLFGEMYFDDKGTVVHNTRTVLIDTHLRVNQIYTNNDWKPGELAIRIRDLLAK